RQAAPTFNPFHLLIERKSEPCLIPPIHGSITHESKRTEQRVFGRSIRGAGRRKWRRLGPEERWGRWGRDGRKLLHRWLVPIRTDDRTERCRNNNRCWRGQLRLHSLSVRNAWRFDRFGNIGVRLDGR